MLYAYGHLDPKENVSYYKHSIYTLARRVKERLDHDPEVNASGIILDTCAWVESAAVNVNLMKFVMNVFEIDIVLVMGADKLLSSLKDGVHVGTPPDRSNPLEYDAQVQKQVLNNSDAIALQNRDTIIVKLPKSGGTISRNIDSRRESRRHVVNEYFYGKLLCVAGSNSNNSVSNISMSVSTSNSVGRASTLATSYILCPARLELKLSSLKIMRVGSVTLHVHEGMKAVGDTTCNNTNPLQVIPAKISVHELKYSLLALVHATDGTATASTSVLSEKSIQLLISNNIAGYLYVIDVVPESDLIIVMSPCPGGELPSKYAFIGSVKHMEQ